MPRGESDRSLQNLRLRDNKKPGAVKTTVNLLPETRSTFADTGDGNMGDGADLAASILREMGRDRLLAQSGVLGRAIALLGAIALDSDSPHQVDASQLCEQLEGLRIDQGYAEEIADGVVKLRSGSWIV